MERLKKHLCALAICLYAHAALATDANQYKVVWVDEEGKHSVAVAVNSQSDNQEISGTEVLNGVTRWSIKDKINKCPIDFGIKIFPESFDVVNVFDSKNRVFLFSYRIACLGGLDPGKVKYMAYFQGVQYMLKGDETVQVASQAWGGESTPVASEKLKQNKKLYNYMMSKWKLVSTTVVK